MAQIPELPWSVPSKNTAKAPFTYAAQELAAFGLAYLHLVDGLAIGRPYISNPDQAERWQKG